MKLLFVCLGNICRSPVAEEIMRTFLKKENLDHILCDSAGTSGYHKNNPPDPRMIECAKKRSYLLTSRSRKFELKDFNNFDYIFTMDFKNYENIRKLDTKDQYTKKIIKITDFCKKHNVTGVPDPYFRAGKDFDLVIDILEDSCEQILLFIKGKIKN